MDNSVIKAQVDELRGLVEKLPEARQGFAKSLIRSFDKYSGLTPNQEPWVAKLIDLAKNPPVPASPAIVGDFIGVYQLFEKALESGLKFPKINLQLADGSALQLYRAGSKSKEPGVINLTDGGPYGNSKWYGRVYSDGKLKPSGAMTDDDITYKAITGLLGELSKNPAGVAAAHGKLTGRCCFCNRPLSDEKSTAAGYGETCAKKYGLHGAWKASVGVLAAESAPKLFNDPATALINKAQAQAKPSAYSYSVPVSETEMLAVAAEVISEAEKKGLTIKNGKFQLDGKALDTAKLEVKIIPSDHPPFVKKALEDEVQAQAEADAEHAAEVAHYQPTPKAVLKKSAPETVAVTPPAAKPQKQKYLF